MTILIAALLLAILWSTIGQVDMVAVASGRLITYVLGPVKKTTTESLTNLYATEAPILATWRALDHFERPQPADYFGPLFSEDDGPCVDWPEPDNPSPKVFAYLRDPATLPTVFEALDKSGAQVIAALPGAPADLLNRHQSDRLRLNPHPVNTNTLESLCHPSTDHVTAPETSGAT